jgi:hypothetical protein
MHKLCRGILNPPSSDNTANGAELAVDLGVHRGVDRTDGPSDDTSDRSKLAVYLGVDRSALFGGDAGLGKLEDSGEGVHCKGSRRWFEVGEEVL